MTTTTITLNPKHYEDYDNSLAAAERDVAAEYDLERWQVTARWDDDDRREAILVAVPEGTQVENDDDDAS